MTADLPGRLLAHLDMRDEQARAATPGKWRRFKDTCWIDAGEYDEVLAPAPVNCATYCYGGTSQVEMTDADADWIAANDPASWLRVSAGFRTIIANAQATLERHHERYLEHGDDEWHSESFAAILCERDGEDWPCADVRATESSLSAVAEALGVQP